MVHHYPYVDEYLAELNANVVDPKKFIKIVKILKLVVSSEKYVNILISWLENNGNNKNSGKIIDDIVHRVIWWPF